LLGIESIAEMLEYPWHRQINDNSIEDQLDGQILRQIVAEYGENIRNMLVILSDVFSDGMKTFTGLRTVDQLWLVASTILNVPFEVLFLVKMIGIH
jgi:hypothetical protein